MTLAMADPLIDDVGGATELTVTAKDEFGQKAIGVVRLTTKAGTFGGDGNNTLIPLIDGTASAPFSCPVAEDPACANGVALVSAEWKGTLATSKVYVGERGRYILEGKDPSTLPGNPGNPASSGKFDPKKVYLAEGWISVGYDSACEVMALPESPKAPFSTIPSMASSKVLSADGSLYYVDQDEKLRRWVADTFPYSANSKQYRCPLSEEAIKNDPIIPTPKCEKVGRVRAWPEGGLVYTCEFGNEYYDEEGKVIAPAGSEILALGYNRTKLIYDLVAWKVADANNQMTDVTGAPTGDRMLWTQRIRARPDGFWALSADRDGKLLELWHISFAGVASKVGAHAPIVTEGYAPQVQAIDGNGDIYATKANGFDDYVLRIPLQPGEIQTIYTEANPPADNWKINPPSVYVTMRGRSMLTGP